MLPPESVHVAELVKEVTDLAGIDDKVDVGFQGSHRVSLLPACR